MVNQGKSPTARWIFKHRKKMVAVFAVLALGVFPFEKSVIQDERASFYVMIAAWVLVALGIMIRIWATAHIFGKKSKELVTSGPYRMLRNPLYFGSLLAAVGIGLLSQSVAVMAGALIAIVFTYMLTVKHEEEKLLQIFGEDYAEFCRTTPRFFPNFLRLPSALSTTHASFAFENLRREYGTGFGFALAAGIVMALQHWFAQLQADGLTPWIVWG